MESDSINYASSIESDIDAVKFIERRREMLQRISNLVNAVQRLTSSLEALLTSSGTNPNIADKAFGLLDYLDNKQKNLTTGKIEIRLEALDNSVRDQLSKILSSIQSSSEDQIIQDNEDTDDADPLEVVTEFRRKVRLSMAYRLLLTERGAETQSINLDVAPELISGCMKRLEHQEAFYKDKLLSEMQQFHSDVSVLLKNNLLSDKLKSSLKTAAKQLKESIVFIKSNKSIDVLPSVLDVSEFGSIKDEEGKAIVAEDEAQDDLVEESEPAKGGFFSTLNNWLSTPTSVSWKDAKKKK